MRAGTIRKTVVGAIAVATVSACGSNNATAIVPSTSAATVTEHPPAGAPKYNPTYLGPWQLSSLSSLSGDLTIPALHVLRSVTFNFGADGRVDGFDGLNHWVGRFTRADAIVAQIKISDVAVGAMGLGPHAWAVQVQLAEAFNLIRSGRPLTMHVTGDQLTINVGTTYLTATRPTAN